MNNTKLNLFRWPCFLIFSTYFWLLGQRPAAIVTPIAGTTRDVLEVTLNIGGYPLVLADTAGLRSKTEDLIEREGISRAINLSEKSDLILLVVDVIRYEKWKDYNPNKGFHDYINEYISNLGLNNFVNNNDTNFFTKQCMIVLNKTDLGSSNIRNIENKNMVKLSCKTEDGAAELVDSIAERLKVL